MTGALENRIAFVTGAGSGIGLQIGDDFAREGARVCLADLDGTAAEAAARDTMVLFAAQTEKLKPQFLIVDTTEFAHRWADDMMAWRDREIIPHYNAGGVTKFAFITGEGAPFPTVESGADPAPDGPATFPTGWFASRDRAYQWLAS